MLRRSMYVLSLALVLAMAAAPILAQTSGSGPTLEDLFTVHNLGSLAIAPDGNAILYTVSSADLEANENNSDIWMARRDGTSWAAPIQMTYHERNDSQPQWRPDGGAFAFLSAGRQTERESDGNGQQLYLMNPRGGEPRTLYAHATSISNFAWAPDGQSIAFRATDEETKEEKEQGEQGRDVEIEDEPGRSQHLWLYDIAADSAIRLTEGREYTVGSFSWSPQGATLAFSATPTDRPGDSWKSDVYTLAIGAPDPTPTRLTSNPGPDANPVWTPDGRFMVYSTRNANRYEIGQNRVARIPATGGTPEDITPRADVQSGTYQFTQDGRGVFYETTTGTTRGLCYMSLQDRNPVRLTPDAGVHGNTTVSKDGRTLAYTFESPNRAEEIYVTTLTGPTANSVRAENPITEHNVHAASWAVGRTDVLRWKGADGRDVEGVLVYPAGWSPGDGPRALVVKVHGGPSGVYVQNFQAASSSADAQRYAAEGYAVLMPNPRGSSGYGEAGLQAVVGDWGGQDFRDIMAGVDTLVARGVAHPDSLGIMGWSYGGYMTAWTVTQTSRFKAAVPGAGITENIAMWGTQDIQHVFEAYFGGGPYEPGMWEVYQKSNPMAFIAEATTPTLIIHGENDPRVPPNQARIFYRGLVANGVTAELMWLPRTGHGPSEPGLRYETARRQKEWMDRWIRSRATERPVSP